MLKHHGIKVTRTCCHRQDGTFGESTRPIPIWILARDIENQVSPAVKYYVHDESLSELDTQDGDKVEIGGEHHFFGNVDSEICEFALIDEIPHVCNLGLCSLLTDAVITRIIERNGILFHHPQREAS